MQGQRGDTLFSPNFLSLLVRYARECEFGNFVKRKNKNNTKKKTRKLLAEFLFK